MALFRLLSICQALALCHANGIVHRDVKPANMVWEWSDEEDQPHIYLIDFGVSVTLNSLAGKTREWDAEGTQLYMSPEIWEYRITSYPTVADSWSAGMTFVELVRHYVNESYTNVELAPRSR